MKKITGLTLTAVLLYFSMAPTCKVNKAALCDDVASGFVLAATQFPNDKLFQELSGDGKIICDAVRAGTGNVAGLIKAFLPKFDKFVALHGQSKGLALVDIGIHILLNHFPAPANETDRAAIADYSNRVVWGCSFYPDRCKNGMPKE